MMKYVKNQHQESSPIIVLVRPQLDENMGMVARAMMNCCLSKLRLVSPRDNHLSEKAISASSGAQKILEEAEVFNSLEEALSDTHYVIATSARKRDMTKEVFSPTDAVMNIIKKSITNQTCAILFGAERTGLENKEIVHANAILEIPLNPLHSSLNLSQAVLLVGYEWSKQSKNTQNTRLETGSSHIATQAELNAFFTHIESELTKRGYFRFKEKKERMSYNLRNIFLRNNLTSSEVKTLHKIVTDLTRDISED